MRPFGVGLAQWFTKKARHPQIEKQTKTIALWERRLFEVAVILGTAWLAYKLNTIGPSEMNKDFGDKELDRNIIFPSHAVDDLMAYGACACLFVGGLVEGLWKRRTSAATNTKVR